MKYQSSCVVNVPLEESRAARRMYSAHCGDSFSGKPEEAARALFYLATALSSYTTGSHIDVSGGIAHHV
jgi:NAD(P)-dependent dehydrogenase (short-subunit alcohol dehydrogenase family)